MYTGNGANQSRESEIVSRESDRFSLPIKFKVRTTLDGANRTEDTATGTVTWKENAIEPARYAKKVS